MRTSTTRDIMGTSTPEAWISYIATDPDPETLVDHDGLSLVRYRADDQTFYVVNFTMGCAWKTGMDSIGMIPDDVVLLDAIAADDGEWTELVWYREEDNRATTDNG